jgi:hypothetical protein
MVRYVKQKLELVEDRFATAHNAIKKWGAARYLNATSMKSTGWRKGRSGEGIEGIGMPDAVLIMW